ncbi:MAG: hypothetical protein V4622_04750 [Bacteroidota bacterium]
MIHTFQIDSTNPVAKTLIEFLKTLDFVKSTDKSEITDEEFELSKEQKEAIDEALESLKKEGGIPHEEVMSGMKKKYPKAFRL